MAVDVRGLFDWLVDGAPGASTPVAVLDRLCPGLVEVGVPLERMAAYVRTLHPNVVGRSFHWQRGGKVEVRELSYALLASQVFLQSPLARVIQTGQEIRRRLDGGAPLGEFPVLSELASQGFTDYLVLPLRFMSSEVHAISYASQAPGGFGDDGLNALREVTRPLTRVGEVLALSRTAVNLLNTYVGRGAGERILAGNIQRGDTETIRCVIWFSDLRGFTSMADTVSPGMLIRALNELFDCQVPAIERHGGEVLKFMGDGMLAIFPIAGDAVRAACETGLDAAKEAFVALDELNHRRVARGDPELRFGMALHLGDVAFGNIGGAGRLDFTCIGPAVNLAARLEGLASKLGKPLVLSSDVAAALGRPARSLGEHELKGVSGKQPVYEPEGG